MPEEVSGELPKNPVEQKTQKWGFTVEHLSYSVEPVFFEQVNSDALAGLATEVDRYFVKQLKENSYAGGKDLLLNLSNVYQFTLPGLDKAKIVDKTIMLYNFGNTKNLTDEQLFEIADALGEAHTQSGGDIMENLSSIMLVPSGHSLLNSNFGGAFKDEKMFVVDSNVLLYQKGRMPTQVESDTGVPKSAGNGFARDTFFHDFIHFQQFAHPGQARAYAANTRGEEPPSQYAKKAEPTIAEDDPSRYREDLPETVVALTYNGRDEGLVGERHKHEADKFRAAAHSGHAIPTIVTCRQVDPHISLPDSLTEYQSRKARDRYKEGINKALEEYRRRTKKVQRPRYDGSYYKGIVIGNAGSELLTALRAIRTQISEDISTQSAEKLDEVKGGALEQLAGRLSKRALEVVQKSEKSLETRGIMSSLRRSETVITRDDGTLLIRRIQDDFDSRRNDIYVEMISSTPDSDGNYLSRGLRMRRVDGLYEIKPFFSWYEKGVSNDFRMVISKDEEGRDRSPFMVREADQDELKNEIQTRMEYLKE